MKVLAKPMGFRAAYSHVYGYESGTYLKWMGSDGECQYYECATTDVGPSTCDPDCSYWDCGEELEEHCG